MEPIVSNIFQNNDKHKMMTDFLESTFKIEGEFQQGNMWQCMDSLSYDTTDDIPFMCMDVVMELLDDDSFYGVNFSGDKQVINMFFVGNHYSFPAIWIGNNDIKHLDEMPIYLFELETKTKTMFKSVGNFRTYIETLLDWFINKYNQLKQEQELDEMFCEPIGEEYIQLATMMRANTHHFSNHVVDKGMYQLNIID